MTDLSSVSSTTAQELKDDPAKVTPLWEEVHQKTMKVVAQAAGEASNYFNYFINTIEWQSQELSIYRELETHTRNQTLTQDGLNDILRRLEAFRVGLAAKNTTLSTSAEVADKD